MMSKVKESNTLKSGSELKFKLKSRSSEELLDVYYQILKPRMIEEKMLLLLRQGKISKWFAGIGQEAIAVGAGLSLDKDEYILPMHRNLGVFTSRGVPLNRLFSQFQGKMSGFTSGRDRSFHFGSSEHKIFGMISHLGAQLGVADGIALGNKLRKDKKATIVFSGEGGTSQGDFHESLNVAAVWDLPVIFIVENNGYGLSTPSSEQFRCEQIIDKGIGYGMEAIRIDGNNIIEVLDTLSDAVQRIRKKPKPILIECMTFRMRGHEEASGTKYVPKHLFEEWEKKDPVLNYENALMEAGVLTEKQREQFRSAIANEIEEGLKYASEELAVTASTDRELSDVYKEHRSMISTDQSSGTKELRLIDAVKEGMHQSMQHFSNLLIMGQDVADYGGVFKATEGFMDEFGAERVRNTPLCESAILGTSLGLSANGYKSIVEMQFADFVSCGFNQIVNNLAKTHYRWGQFADVVVRMPTGAGVGAGPFHSQSNEGWFFHTPGLKIAYPAFPADAKGLLISAIDEPNPVMFFEHKALYRSISGPVPDNFYRIPFGKANLVQSGEQVTVIAYGLAVHWALKEMEAQPEVSADIIDLRTLVPWDKETVAASVKKTGKVIVLHEDTITGGIGGEISAWISENLFEYLDAPIMRCGSLDTPVPFAAKLEENFLPVQRFKEKLGQLLAY